MNDLGDVHHHRPAAAPIAPDRTMIVRPRRRTFDATTLLVSGVATSLFCAFATVAALA